MQVCRRSCGTTLTWTNQNQKGGLPQRTLRKTKKKISVSSVVKFATNEAFNRREKMTQQPYTTQTTGTAGAE
jgi:hypothetical protein